MIDLIALWKELTKGMDNKNAGRYRPSAWIPCQAAQAAIASASVELGDRELVLQQGYGKAAACAKVADAYKDWAVWRIKKDAPTIAEVFNKEDAIAVEIEVVDKEVRSTEVEVDKTEVHEEPIASIEFSEELALALVRSNEQFPVDFDDAWNWIGYSRKDSAKTALESAGFFAGQDFRVFQINLENSKGGRRPEKISLTVDCFKSWAMMAGTEQGKRVRQYFLNCERIAKESVAQPQQPAHTLQDALSLADYVAATMSDCGVDPVFVACDRFNILASMLPQQAEALAAAKQNLLQGATTQDVAINPTAIGRLVSRETGRICSPVFINKMLIDIGWQEQTNTANTTYIATELGKPHSASRRIKTDNYEGFHLHWFPKTTVPALVRFIQTGEMPSEGVAQ